MKKQQNFSDLAGILLLAAVLVGVFIFVSKPTRPKETVAPTVTEIVLAPVKMPAEAPVPVAPKEAPRPPEVIKPKVAVAPPVPKRIAEITKPRPAAEAPKPRAPEKPKPVKKKVVAQVPQQKNKFSVLQMFKPKPKPAAVVPVPTPLPAPVAEIPKKGRIGIVLDDWGYNKNNLSIIDRIKYPFTAAVLPDLSYSKQMANELHKRGIEIILHLPMQPHGPVPLEKNTVTASLDDNSIRNIVKRDLNLLSYAKGVNNHMGSLATEDPRVMEVVLKELKRRQLYFLDSYVTPNTVCQPVASKIGVPFAERDVFLDNQEDPQYIEAQIYKLKEVADRQGYVIGIGHDRKNTLEALIKLMPELAKEGYRFVTVSELIKNEHFRD